MNFEFVRTPWWIRLSNPFATWQIKTSEKSIYLTFDDSPSPMTSFILDCLDRYNAKATFFCIGNNVTEHPSVFHQIVSAQHTIGNHTMSHANGWQTPLKSYIQEFEECNALLSDGMGKPCNLFRPPFGRMSFRQSLHLRSATKIVMWDVLSLDYRRDVEADQVADNVISYCRPGSIPLLHDSELAADRVKIALPMILESLRDQGYSFKAIKLK